MTEPSESVDFRCVHIMIKDAKDDSPCIGWSTHIPLEVIHGTPRIYIELFMHEPHQAEGEKPKYYYKSPPLEIEAV